MFRKKRTDKGWKIQEKNFKKYWWPFWNDIGTLTIHDDPCMVGYVEESFKTNYYTEQEADRKIDSLNED